MIRRLRVALAGACVLLRPRARRRRLRRAPAAVADDSSHAAIWRGDRRGRRDERAERPGHRRHRRVDAARGRPAVRPGRLGGDPEQPAAALANHPELVGSTPSLGDESIDELDVLNDGQHVLTLDQRHHAWLYDVSSGQLLADTQVGPVRRGGRGVRPEARRGAGRPNGRRRDHAAHRVPGASAGQPVADAAAATARTSGSRLDGRRPRVQRGRYASRRAAPRRIQPERAKGATGGRAGRSPDAHDLIRGTRSV